MFLQVWTDFPEHQTNIKLELDSGTVNACYVKDRDPAGCKFLIALSDEIFSRQLQGQGKVRPFLGGMVGWVYTE